MTRTQQDDPFKNSIFFKIILTAQLSGKTALPHRLGLKKTVYNKLICTMNNDNLNRQELIWFKEESKEKRKRADIYEELIKLKSKELNTLLNLLEKYRDHQQIGSMQMTTIICSACLSQYHLWESLGLENRKQLNELLHLNFPKLHALNTNNMRWKRFFYHHLCKQEGDYICKSPSCTKCTSYKECYT